MAHIPFDSFVEAFHAVNKGTQSRIRMGQFMALMPRDHDWEAGCKVLHEYGDIFVERALKYQESWRTRGADVGGKIQDRYVFLQELAKQITDPKELRNQLLGILLVGSETTASLLAGCVSLLSNRPTLWTKLHKEAVDLGIPNNESVKAFTSLNYVINEGILRLL